MKLILSLFLISTVANAAVVSRIHTFTDGSILTASQLNTEYNNIVDNINSLDNDNLSNSANIDPKKVAASVAGDGLGRNGSTGILSVNVDSSTIETSGDSLRVKDGGITTAKLAAGVFPIGSMTMYVGSSAPSGWAICNGQAVSRTTYATLFALIGTTYGSGDGVTTFNLPDLRSRFPIGAGTGSGLSTRTLGSTGGNETHTLTEAQIPSHSHSATQGNHSHTIGTQSGNSGVNTSSDFIAKGIISNAYGTPATSSDSAGPITIGNTGGGGSHPIMNPYMAVNFIMKIN